MSTNGVHTDPHAVADLAEAAEHEHGAVAPDGSIVGYKAGRTLPLRVELARQLRRRRTQLLLGFLVLLPVILVVAFELGESSPNRRAGGFVDLATAGGVNFVVLTLFVSAGFLLPMIVALFFGDTIASEASWSSLKYLLAAPVPRHRLLRQKALASGLLSLLALVLLPTVALAVGVVWYGAGEVVSPTGEAAPFGQGVAGVALSVVYIAIQLFWVAGLALFLSVSTDAPLGAVGGAVLAAILSQILDQITALEDLRNYLPTHYSLAWADLLSTDIDWSQPAKGVFSSLAYGAFFTLLAARGFARKDITS
ncbi:ABC transporter permease subunit [Saccharothrix violaceirubra]|uniref:ABC-2 type transport system permease protein n=1 Tax=Saccharothrix violaceirubra TaxID=413306 RepID=A0A7W7T125_9PSEU|nr:ABC transporter permease subunit [Saccharothrix violaceirubra]MBB4964316.1 ABC-2 type transport system permease protein [Saccharothrix violaceirubra]